MHGQGNETWSAYIWINIYKFDLVRKDGNVRLKNVDKICVKKLVTKSAETL